MNEIPSGLRYAGTHEWARLDENGHVIVGITDYAQEQLGDVVYIELPELAQQVQIAAEAAVVESVKAASDIYAPISGEVVAVNEALADEPELVNKDPYNHGWFFRIAPADAAELQRLLDANAYAQRCEAADEATADDEAT